MTSAHLALLAGGLLALLAPGPALARPASDALSKCVKDSVTATDKESIMLLSVEVLSAHPSLESLINITPGRREEIQRSAGATYSRILFADCRGPLIDALQSQGPEALGGAIALISGSITSEISTHPLVMLEASKIANYLDKDQMRSIAGELAKRPKPAN